MNLNDLKVRNLLIAGVITLGEYNAFLDYLMAEFDRELAEGTSVMLIGAC